MVQAKDIPDDATLCRMIFEPHMYAENVGLMPKAFFQFPKDEKTGERHESLAWTEFAPIPGPLNEVGCGIESKKLDKYPEAKYRYRGYAPSTALAIRSINSARNHGFTIVHDPQDDDWHVKIAFRVAPGSELKPGDRNELKFTYLPAVFGAHIVHSCQRKV